MLKLFAKFTELYIVCYFISQTFENLLFCGVLVVYITVVNCSGSINSHFLALLLFWRSCLRLRTTSLCWRCFACSACNLFTRITFWSAFSCALMAFSSRYSSASSLSTFCGVIKMSSLLFVMFCLSSL